MTSNSGPSSVTSHTCNDAKVDARVFVNGVRIPIGSVDVHIRKEGPLDTTRYVEGTFASPFQTQGASEPVDYLNAFKASSPETQASEGGFDDIQVDVKDYKTKQFLPSFRGIVTGVGNADGPERLWKFRAQGPGMILDKIPVSQDFAAGAKDKLVLGFIREQLNGKLPFSIGGGVVGGPDAPAVAADRQRSDEFTVGGGGDGGGGLINSQKSFQKNRHSLADVASFYMEHTGNRLRMIPVSGDNGVILASGNKFNLETTHRAHYMGGNLQVVDNNALSELRPINTLVVRGKAARTVTSVGDRELNLPRDRFVSAKVRHRQLYKRAGETELHADLFTKSGANTKFEVQAEAQKRLKERVDETTSGDMITLQRSPMRPFDIIKARPTCNESPATNTEPLDYEVSRVHHRIRSGQHSTTKVNVGLHTDKETDIVLLDTWVGEA